MGIKKNEMIDQLESAGLDVTDLDYNGIRKAYKQYKKVILDNVQIKKNDEGAYPESTLEEGVPEQWHVPEVEEDVPEKTIREKLIEDIIEFVPTIISKSRGTEQEIKTMFHLYNNFYKRNESRGCGVCLGNVKRKLVGVYKKYKK